MFSLSVLLLGPVHDDELVEAGPGVVLPDELRVAAVTQHDFGSGEDNHVVNDVPGHRRPVLPSEGGVQVALTLARDCADQGADLEVLIQGADLAVDKSSTMLSKNTQIDLICSCASHLVDQALWVLSKSDGGLGHRSAACHDEGCLHPSLSHEVAQSRLQLHARL